MTFVILVVESLVTVPVKDYADIDNRIEEGTRNRTVAATNMNATSRYGLSYLYSAIYDATLHQDNKLLS